MRLWWVAAAASTFDRVVGGGEGWWRTVVHPPPPLSLGLCPGDTSHLKFKRAAPAGSRPFEVVKLKFKFPVEIKAAANWADSSNAWNIGRKSWGRYLPRGVTLIFHEIARGYNCVSCIQDARERKKDAFKNQRSRKLSSGILIIYV